MRPSLDDDVVQRVDDLGITAWSGITYRYTSRGRDALSGAGARANGGRWNPRDVFAAIYLAQPAGTSMRELDRVASASAMMVTDLLERGFELHTVTVTDLRVLDLRGEKELRYVGLSLEEISDEDWTACQAVGHAAWFLEMQGVLAPSATGSGLVLTVFESRIIPDQLQITESRHLSEQMYRSLS